MAIDIAVHIQPCFTRRSLTKVLYSTFKVGKSYGRRSDQFYNKHEHKHDEQTLSGHIIPLDYNATLPTLKTQQLKRYTSVVSRPNHTQLIE